MQQGGFARPRRADDCYHLSAPDLQIEIAKDHYLLDPARVNLRQVDGAQHDISRHPGASLRWNFRLWHNFRHGREPKDDSQTVTEILSLCLRARKLPAARPRDR